MPTQPISPADSRSYLGFDRQTTKGTAVPPAFFATYVGAVAFAHNPNLREIREAGGGFVPARQVKDFIAPGITFGAPMRPDLFGAVAAFFLGEDTIGGAGPFDHVIRPVDGRELVTFERNIADDIVERIVDGVITQLTLSYQTRDSGPELMFASVAEGRTETDEAAPTAEVYETERPFLRSDCTWLVDAIGQNLTPTNVEACTIDIVKEFDATILADSIVRSDIVPLRYAISIELIQLFESADEALSYRLTHYYDGATQTPGTTPGEVVYPGDLSVTAGYDTGVDEREIIVAVPNIDWGEAELTENDPEGSEAVRMTRRGIAVVAAAPIQVDVKNNNAVQYIP